MHKFAAASTLISLTSRDAISVHQRGMLTSRRLICCFATDFDKTHATDRPSTRLNALLTNARRRQARHVVNASDDFERRHNGLLYYWFALSRCVARENHLKHATAL
jgi:hypothetical protein